MTNREYIKTLTNEKLADILSNSISDCDDCPIRNYCNNDSDFFGVCYHIWLKWLKDECKEVKPTKNEKCSEFNKLFCTYNRLLYTIRCNMTSITRYIRNENEAYDMKYKELAEKAVENILEVTSHKEIK